MSFKSTRQFKDGVDEAFEAMKTRDKAKACYDFARDIAGSSRGGHRAPPEVGIGHLPRWTVCALRANFRISRRRPPENMLFMGSKSVQH